MKIKKFYENFKILSISKQIIFYFYISQNTKMKTLLKILTLGLIYLICQPIFAQKNAKLKLDFEKIIRSKHSFPFNGVVIVSKNGKTMYEKVHFWYYPCRKFVS